MNMLYARILHREKDDIDDVCFDDGKKRKGKPQNGKALSVNHFDQQLNDIRLFTWQQKQTFCKRPL